MVQGSAITGLSWSGDKIVSACDANSIIKIWDSRMLSSGGKVRNAMATSEEPIGHHLRAYGITSIVAQHNRIFALSKDSRYIPSSSP